MEYTIPSDHPLGSIEVEYDRLDYFLRRNIPDALLSTCASLRQSASSSREHLFIADLFEGLFALAEGRLDEGMPKLRAALAGPPYVRVRAASAIAAQEVALGNLIAAAEILRPLIAENPPSAPFHTSLASYLAISGDAAGAWTSYVRALQINPTHLPALWLMQPLASSAEQRHHYKDLLRGFLEIEPENGDVRTHLASCLYALGDIEGARTEIQRIVAFLEVAPVSESSLEDLRNLTSTIAGRKTGENHG